MRRYLWLGSAFLLAAVLGLPLDDLIKPVLWLSVVVVALAFTFGTQAVAARALVWTLALSAFVIGWGAFTANVHEVLGASEANHGARSFACGAFLAGFFGVLVVALWAIARVRALLPTLPRQERAHFRPRARLIDPVHPELRVPDRQAQPRGDDLGLLGGDRE